MSLLWFYSELLFFTMHDFKHRARKHSDNQSSFTICSTPFFSLSLLCLRCIPGALLYSPHPHWHPLVLPGAGSGSEDQAWQHRGVELRLPTAGRHWGFQSDGKSQHELINQLTRHIMYSTVFFNSVFPFQFFFQHPQCCLT